MPIHNSLTHNILTDYLVRSDQIIGQWGLLLREVLGAESLSHGSGAKNISGRDLSAQLYVR